MPAECQVDDCGIAAIGRCATCNLAFCATHQGMSPSRYLLVDRCARCEAASVAAARAHGREYGREFLSSGAARQMLLAAHVPTVDLSTLRSAWETRRFGRSRRVDSIVPLGRGWLLGPFRWRFSDGGNYGGSDTEAACDSMLLDRSERPGYGEGGLSGFWGADFLVRVRPGAHGYELLYVRGRGEGTCLASWEQLALRVRQLAGVQ